MAPALSLADAAYSDREALSGKENKVDSAAPKENAIRHTSNFQDTMFEMEAMLNEHTVVPERTEEAYIDVVECSKSVEIKKPKDENCSKSVEIKKVKDEDCSKFVEIKKVEEEDADATEQSSSFDGTVSGTDNYNGKSESEVQSQISVKNHMQYALDTRRKWLTTEWTSFIRPLAWRCKWAELRIREIESQALKYDREITEMERSKQYEHRLEDFCSKALPFCHQHRRTKLMKRRRRRSVEDTANRALYMSNHNVFSYFENRKSDADGTSTADDFCNPVVTQQKEDGGGKVAMGNDPSFFEFEDSEISFERILWSIEMVHDRVQKMKIELKALISCNSGRLNLVLPLPSPDQETSSPSGFDIGDHLLPETAVSSYREDTNMPDIIERTVGLLTSADDALLIMDDSCKDIVENVLIHNQGAEENNASAVSSENPIARAPEQPSLSSCLALELRFPRNKRKRAERRSGLGGWSHILFTDLDGKS